MKRVTILFVVLLMVFPMASSAARGAVNTTVFRFRDLALPAYAADGFGCDTSYAERGLVMVMTMDGSMSMTTFPDGHPNFGSSHVRGTIRTEYSLQNAEGEEVGRVRQISHVKSNVNRNNSNGWEYNWMIRGKSKDGTSWHQHMTGHVKSSAGGPEISFEHSNVHCGDEDLEDEPEGDE